VDGQYAHNTGVWDNINDTDGGWQGYKSNNGNESDNLATSLSKAGYRTGLIGCKYIEYEGGVREYYDLGADPCEPTNNDPEADPCELTNIYNSSPPPDALVTQLQALKSCANVPAGIVTCRQAEDGQ
jgi:hypothetical protein